MPAGPSVARIVPSLLGAADASWLPEVARDVSSTRFVLLVLDGLGWSAREEHASLLPALREMQGGPIRTVVPSTTATALTSIATGLDPAQHGIVGYRMLVGSHVLNVLRWSASGGHAPDPFDVQRHTAFLGREVPVVTRSEFRTTGFTEAHLRGARFVGWHTTATLVEQCVRCVADGERLTYAYYPGVDTVAHEFGLHDTVYRRELAFADRLVGELLDALPPDTVLLVTSDHGQVHLEPSSWLDCAEVVAQSRALAGDGRFRYCYAHPGHNAKLLDAARRVVGERGEVWTRGELLESGLMGAGATGSIPGRIGDVVMAARDAIAFVDPALPKEPKLRSGHGSITDDEMLVPLVAARGRGAVR